MMLKIALWATVAATFLIGGISHADEREVLRCASNPHPDRLPTLGVWQKQGSGEKENLYYTYLSARFPNVPNFTCDMWCFESQGVIYKSAREIDGGCVELRHDWESHDWEVVTTVTPYAGAVDLVSRLEPLGGTQTSTPEEYPYLNVCWQLRRAEDFASEPEPYPEFVRRCFIFTDRGREFLLDLSRRPIPRLAQDDEYNNPPWVQMYAPKSAPLEKRSGPTAWADYSDARFTIPLIGAVSRDRKYLTALASRGEDVCQAWHDCMHNNSRWLPAVDGTTKEWRLRVYAMRNDPNELLGRFHEDFPDIEPIEKPQ